MSSACGTLPARASAHAALYVDAPVRYPSDAAVRNAFSESSSCSASRRSLPASYQRAPFFELSAVSVSKRLTARTESADLPLRLRGARRLLQLRKARVPAQGVEIVVLPKIGLDVEAELHRLLQPHEGVVLSPGQRIRAGGVVRGGVFPIAELDRLAVRLRRLEVAVVLVELRARAYAAEPLSLRLAARTIFETFFSASLTARAISLVTVVAASLVATRSGRSPGAGQVALP